MCMKKITINYKSKSFLALIIIIIASFVLFYRYMYELYMSDFQAHLEHSLDGTTYSLNLILMPVFYKLTGSNMGIVILMSLLTVASVFTLSLFIRYILSIFDVDIDLYSIIPFGCSLMFISKLCIPEWSNYYYIGAFSTQPWHNSTYIEMRCLAMLTLILYFRIRKDYLEKISYRDCILFTLSLLITNFAKPNFLLAFAPAMLCVLIYDFIKTRGKSFKNAFIFGLCVLISCAVVLIQYTILFPSDGNSQVIISVEHALSYFVNDNKFFLYILLNYLFPLYVTYLFIVNRKKISVLNKKIFGEVWLMNIISILISMFVIETGRRALHGNFTWNNPFFAFVLFAVSMASLIIMKKKNIIENDLYLLGKAIYFLHFVMGLFYFVLLIMGYVPYGI